MARKVKAPVSLHKELAQKQLPICWLGRTVTVIRNGKMEGLRITKKMVNPKCVCTRERLAFFCEHGNKLRQCDK